ncbi:MAG: metallopeptidase family protein [Alphaproteobacteria bacterium]|nr:metallopeptidase family protein [Alphaproteobacteria bacterium]
MCAQTTRPDILSPTVDQLAALAEDALSNIPVQLLQPLSGLAILVEDFPDEEVCEAMDLETPFDLLGLYQGMPLGHRSTGETPADLDRVFLYRRPILDYWIETGEDLYQVVRHVLIHEIGHHYGYTDAEMEELERQADENETNAPAGRA